MPQTGTDIGVSNDAFYTKPRAKRPSTRVRKEGTANGFRFNTLQHQREKTYQHHMKMVAGGHVPVPASEQDMTDGPDGLSLYHRMTEDERNWHAWMVAAYADAIRLMSSKVTDADKYLFGHQSKPSNSAHTLKLFCDERERLFMVDALEDRWWYYTTDTLGVAGDLPYTGVKEPFHLYGRHVSRAYDVVVDIRTMHTEFYFPQTREAAWAVTNGVVDMRAFPFIAFYWGEGDELYGVFGGAQEFLKAVRRPRAIGW